jgi:triacylglycerol esterase/lipase EstA (alpha/beta hydrolase family)
VRKERNKDISAANFQLMFEKMKQCRNVREATKIPIDGKFFSYGTWLKVMRSRGRIILKQKGKKSVWNDHQVDLICDYIGENNNNSLKEILDYSINELNCDIYLGTIPLPEINNMETDYFTSSFQKF